MNGNRGEWSTGQPEDQALHVYWGHWPRKLSITTVLLGLDIKQLINHQEVDSAEAGKPMHSNQTGQWADQPYPQRSCPKPRGKKLTQPRSRLHPRNTGGGNE